MTAAIRYAQATDLAAIVAIYNQGVRLGTANADIEEVSLESRRAWFAEHTPTAYPIFVLEADTEILGWAALSPWRSGRMGLRKVAEVTYYVDENHRGKGYASLLMAHCLRQAPELGFRHLIAILLDINEPSLQLLSKFSFERWGCLPDVVELPAGRCSHVIYGRQL